MKQNTTAPAIEDYYFDVPICDDERTVRYFSFSSIYKKHSASHAMASKHSHQNEAMPRTIDNEAHQRGRPTLKCRYEHERPTRSPSNYLFRDFDTQHALATIGSATETGEETSIIDTSMIYIIDDAKLSNIDMRAADASYSAPPRTMPARPVCLEPSAAYPNVHDRPLSACRLTLNANLLSPIGKPAWSRLISRCAVLPHFAAGYIDWPRRSH